MMKPAKTRITDPLLLQPAAAGVLVPSESVAIVTTPQLDRDYYRLGVGIDFIELVKVLAGKEPPAAVVPAAPKAPSSAFDYRR